MQSKISAFFKTSSSSLIESPNPPPITEENGELDIWETKEHQFFNAYTRRARDPNSGEREKAKDSQRLEKTVSGSITSKSESFTPKKTMVKNKKRSYAQYHLDLGQSDFNFHSCFTCGFKYSPGDESDEKTHKEFHKNYTHGIQFKGWSSERVIQMPTIEGGRIVMVLDSDSTAQKKKVVEAMNMMEIELGSGFIFPKFCKVLLFILSSRVAGCLIAEPIEKAFKVISNSADNDAINTKEQGTKPTILQFGDISFQRETVKRSHSASNTNMLDGDLGNAVVCEEVAVPAVCGIRAIWVSPVNRRKRIATQLLDAVRKSFCTGFVLERSQLAFSPLTWSGKALASSYIGKRSFLVYKPNILNSVEST
ncbi:protein CHROMOSOME TRANSMISSION FIDELITY 7 [Humulus lupulus]|uniref:protein CHROMOSOME TRANSMISSION FIDELITY 7 n=1 Tax=Humulus lupulus TaxID=3486 RepID=UPI002B403507|nr:protein CHROMOSOME TRANSMISSION FIDELITY 7 [Humulus lupulus]